MEARYRRLAGDDARRAELYWARRILGFTIDEWQALPWWQRRVYVEGAEDENAARNQGGDTGGDYGGGDLASALLDGTLDDVNRAKGQD